MKVLVFHIGPDRYGLPLRAITRVLPLVEFKQLPMAPPCVAGLMELHGEPLLVIDLTRLAGLEPAPACFDARILLVDYTAPDGAVHPLGLLAEHVLGVDSIDPGALRSAGIEGAPFLGQVAGAGQGMLQLVELEQLLGPELRALLFDSRSGQ